MMMEERPAPGKRFLPSRSSEDGAKEPKLALRRKAIRVPTEYQVYSVLVNVRGIEPQKQQEL